MMYIVNSADIDDSAICGFNMPVCPGNTPTRVTGGRSSCAEKIPWNVLIERTPPQLNKAGITIMSQYKSPPPPTKKLQFVVVLNYHLECRVESKQLVAGKTS